MALIGGFAKIVCYIPDLLSQRLSSFDAKSNKNRKTQRENLMDGTPKTLQRDGKWSFSSRLRFIFARQSAEFHHNNSI